MARRKKQKRTPPAPATRRWAPGFIVMLVVGALALAGAYLVRAGNGPSSAAESGSDATGIAALVEREIAANGDPAAARAAVEERVIALLAEREELDATVWAEERLAQQYENTFVGLWDDLRNSDNAFDVFRAFEIDETRIGRPGAATPLLEGIHVAPLDQSPETLGRDGWLSLLDRLEAEGFSLVQSEFHHSQFDSNGEGGVSPPSASSFTPSTRRVTRVTRSRGRSR